MKKSALKASLSSLFLTAQSLLGFGHAEAADLVSVDSRLEGLANRIEQAALQGLGSLSLSQITEIQHALGRVGSRSIAQLTFEEQEELARDLESRVGWHRLREFYSDLDSLSEHAFGSGGG